MKKQNLKKEIEKILIQIRNFNDDWNIDIDYQNDHPEIGKCLDFIDSISSQLRQLKKGARDC